MGDAVNDVANGLNTVIGLLQQTKTAVGNDLIIGPQLTNAIAQLQSIQSSFNSAISTLQSQVGTLQGQLAQCQQKPAQTIVTSPAPTSTTPSAGVSPTTTSFIAVGAALVGGVTGYIARGKVKK